MEFTHLHVHSHYSTLDGANRIPDLVARAAELGMKALALSDHGNLFGAMEFYLAARSAGIKPILGMEAYMAPGRRYERAGGGENAYRHLLLLATNDTGWRNLMVLSSRGYTEGFYYKPRIDRELLAGHAEGLVATSACIAGEIPQALLNGDEAAARRIAGEYLDIFGRDRFFIEIQDQGDEEQRRVNPMLIRLAREFRLGLVATNDVHFLRRESKPGHEVLTCISTNRRLTDADRMQYSKELYLKGPEEMASLFADWPEALKNTMRIAEMCDVRLEPPRKYLPVFPLEVGETPAGRLRKLAEDGLVARFGGAIPEEYRRRLDRELEVIEQKGYSSYFLIVHDFVRFARENNIPAMPRGSGVATLLGYAIGISHVDPLRYGLLFERFTDPERQEDPDVDIDVCQVGRERVIRYVREKYGHVAQIITFATLKARAAIKDAARVLGMTPAEGERFSKMVPEDLKASIGAAINRRLPPEQRHLFSPALCEAYEKDPQARRLLDCAMQIEGLVRQPGVHAAGVVVCDQPLENLLPLYRQNDSPDVITQWDGPTCEKAGLMKMDILGLKTLSVIQRARELVREKTGVDIDPHALPLDDPAVFALFQAGETDGVFQFESAGMKAALRDIRPTRIEDLIAANAMYRPGPRELIPLYAKRKRGEAPVEKIHPLVDPLLAETYGIMVYQEQIMQVVNRLGGFSLSRALSLIKAISKKKEAAINAERPRFIEGAARNGISRAEAERLFDLILKFADYGFNKAHSTGYAIVAYQTAWFKVHHPLEFWAATLTFESDDRDKLVQYLADCRRMGISITPPDINASGGRFNVDGDRIRFGLLAVKGVGQNALEAILAARTKGGPFCSLYDFCLRVDSRAVNRAAIESLIRCGAFDGIESGRRAALIAGLGAVMEAAQRDARDRAAGQGSLFEIGGDAAPTAFALPNTPEWGRDERMQAEKETIGLYVSHHPLDTLTAESKAFAVPADFAFAEIESLKDDQMVAGLALVVAVRVMVNKSGESGGQRMARLTLEDLTGRCEAVVFAREYEPNAGWIREDEVIYLVGQISRWRDRPEIRILEIYPLREALRRRVQAVEIAVRESELADTARLEALKRLLQAHEGDRPVCLRVRPANKGERVPYVIELGPSCRVTPTPELLAAAREVFEPRLVTVRCAGLEPRKSFTRGRPAAAVAG